MADEILRMQAEVQDRYSGPLKALRAQLLDTARTGANHSETLAKGFGTVEGALQKTARTATSVVNPAFAALGVTGLSAGAAVAGISNALNKLTGSMLSLGALSRETGVAAKTLQEFGSVAGRFGIEQDAVASATKNFAAQMRTFSRSTGEAFRWVMQQGTNAEGRKAFQDFATDLQRTSDEGEKLKKALAFMETIKNPVERGIFAQQFFGNQDLGRIADGHLGRVVDLFKKAREKLGEFRPEDIIDAEKFDRSVSSLKGSMQRLGTTIAREVLGPATELTTWADSLVSGQRADVTKTLREGLQEVKKQLAEINWKQFGEDTVAGLKAGTALAGSLASALHQIAETIHNLRSGNYAEAFASADNITGPVLPGREEGADGPLRRQLAPRIGDDEIEARQRVEDLKKLRAAAVEAQGHFIGRTQQRMGLLGSPESYDKDLDAAQAKLRALEGRTPEQRQKDFEATEKLRKALDANTEELKASRNGATVQKQSMDTQGGLFGEATFQTASYGSSQRSGRRLPPIDPGQREVRRRAAEGNAGNPDAGWFGGRAGQDAKVYGSEQGSRSRIAPVGPRPDVSPADPSGGYVGNDGRRAARGRLTEAGRARIASWMEFLQKPVAEGGLGMSKETAMADIAMMQGESGLNLEPGIPGDHDRNGVPHAFGTAQWSDAKGNPRFPLLRKFAESRGKQWTDVETQQQYHRMEMLGLPGAVSHRRAYEAMMRAGSGEDTLREGIDKYENPQKKALAFQIRRPFLDRLRRDQAGATAERADGGRAGRADGVAWAAREAARKTFEAQQADAAGLRSSGARVAATAARAGVVAMPKVENNGSVVVNVLKPGPETRVATTASGNLFQDVLQRSGAQMRRAD